ncbi:unnamed protein product [marine sediment metagenome]|uniref:DUF2460 domain-containing protein n=1 Tax=marine sediment metagenome TaxID=412755 RepID=X1ADL9_9ZZZZ
MISDIEIIAQADWYLRNPLAFGFEWKTDIVEYDTGVSQRNAIWTRPRRMWTLNWNAMLTAEKDNILLIHQRARGSYDSFLLMDAFDHDGVYSVTQSQIPVVASDLTDDWFEVDSNCLASFSVDSTFYVLGGNNQGTYTVASATYISDTDRTRIVVDENVTHSEVSGNILMLEFQLTHTYAFSAQSWAEDKPYIVTDSQIVNVKGVPQSIPGNYSISAGKVTFVSGSVPAHGDEVTATFEFYFPVRFKSDIITSTKIAPNVWQYGGVQLVEVK